MFSTNIKELNLHLVSDSTGETLGAMARAILSQFPKVNYHEHMWSLVRTRGQMKLVIEEIRKKPGVVLYTLLDQTLLDNLLTACHNLQVPCLAALEQLTKFFADYLKESATYSPGRQHQLDSKYFAKIDAINYSLDHDDGQHLEGLSEADIILVGPSRTSKSPTSMYLAHRGFKTANIPLVPPIKIPQELLQIEQNKIIGLTISRERLIQIRRSRLINLNKNLDNNYVDHESVAEEILTTKKLYLKHHWPVIDVTRKSVEETVAEIIFLLKRN